MSTNRRTAHRSRIARTGCFQFNTVSAGTIRRGVSLADAIEHGADFVASTIDGAQDIVHGLPKRLTLVFDFPFGEQVAYVVELKSDLPETRENLCVSILKMSLAILDGEGWPSDGISLMGVHASIDSDAYLLEFGHHEPAAMAHMCSERRH